MANIRIKRGTRAQLNAAAAASGLSEGEPYLVTDGPGLALGTGVDTYVDIGAGAVSTFEVDGGSASTSFIGTLQVDFGGAA